MGNFSEILGAIRSISDKGAKLIVPVALAAMILYPWVDRNFLAANRVLDHIAVLQEYNEIDNLSEMAPESQALYGQIRDDVQMLTERARTPESLRHLIGANLGKFISGALLLAMVAVAVLFTKTEKAWQRIGSFVVALAIAFAAGLVGAFLPTVGRPWVNYVGFPIVQLILAFALIRPRMKPSDTKSD